MPVENMWSIFWKIFFYVFRFTVSFFGNLSCNPKLTFTFLTLDFAFKRISKLCFRYSWKHFLRIKPFSKHEAILEN